MLRRSENPLTSDGACGREALSQIVVAGPGSSLTIPGIIVSEIVRSVADRQAVLRIEVDLGTHPTVGLHRAPSLAAANDWLAHTNISLRRMPKSSGTRKKIFQSVIGPEVRIAVAYAWPGIDNSWIPQFLKVAREAGAVTTVVCESLPHQVSAKAGTLASIFSAADRVIVGELSESNKLLSAFGGSKSVIETHRALSLGGREGRRSCNQIAAFLPKGNVHALATLLAAFDAIPDANINEYKLRVHMRYAGQAIPSLVANCHHADHVELIDEDLLDADLQELFELSSAVIVADPNGDSRVLSTAINSGIATVVLSKSTLPDVGRGYVGGLLANRSQPSSVHVALRHALRLAELGFPHPDDWDELGRLITETKNQVKIPEQIPRPRFGAHMEERRTLEPTPFIS